MVLKHKLTGFSHREIGLRDTSLMVFHNNYLVLKHKLTGFSHKDYGFKDIL